VTFVSYDKTRDEAVDQRIASELPTIYSETQLSVNQASPSCPSCLYLLRHHTCTPKRHPRAKPHGRIMLMAVARAPKKPWIAALLALVLGGPGCFYLGWRRGVVATLGWMFALPLPLVGMVSQFALGQDANLEFAILFLFSIHAGLAWMAYRSCKRVIAETLKKAEGPESDPIQRAQVQSVKEIRNTGLRAAVFSGFTLFGSVMSYVNTTPPMGELGHFTHAVAPVLAAMSLWGVATGIGLRRAYRWAWISMLVFGGLLTAFCTLPVVGLLMSGGVDANSLLGRVIGVLMFLPLAGIGVWWFTFFLRANVKSYFGIPRKAPEASA
jgi:hypothetical protein